MLDRLTARRALERAIARASRLWVASDFDGTLAAIVPHPGRAVLSPRARRALQRLAAAPGVQVALLSGRTLSDLERRVRLPGLTLVGLAGIEMRDARGRHVTCRTARVPDPLNAELERWCERFRGAWIERKGPVVAVHFRAVRGSRQRAFAAGLRRRATPHRDRIELEPGKKIVELRPRGAPGKAEALLSWFGRGTRGTAASTRAALVFFGDDNNDEQAHAVVRRLGGIAIAVGRRRTRATFRLSRPSAVVELMEWLARAWRAKGARPALSATGRSRSPGSRPLRPGARGASAPRVAARS